MTNITACVFGITGIKKLISISLIILHLANCGPPSTFQNGYVYPFTSTLEGARVVFTCSKPAGQEFSSPLSETIETVCSENGTWIPNSIILCTEQSNSGMFSCKLNVQLNVQFIHEYITSITVCGSINKLGTVFYSVS